MKKEKKLCQEYGLIINKHNQNLTSIMENERWQQGFHENWYIGHLP